LGAHGESWQVSLFYLSFLTLLSLGRSLLLCAASEGFGRIFMAMCRLLLPKQKIDEIQPMRGFEWSSACRGKNVWWRMKLRATLTHH
jgi:hypothetical protein